MAVYKTATKIHRQPYNEESCYHYNILCIALLKKKVAKRGLFMLCILNAARLTLLDKHKSRPLEKFCSGRQ